MWDKEQAGTSVIECSLPFDCLISPIEDHNDPCEFWEIVCGFGQDKVNKLDALNSLLQR